MVNGEIRMIRAASTDSEVVRAEISQIKCFGRFRFSINSIQNSIIFEQEYSVRVTFMNRERSPLNLQENAIVDEL